uniref:Iron-binding zinc finger CDGSH type domain-containing protein n=1 Tax=Ciona savignyi TaxID=51511 RepID=H2Y8F0_CIOSA
MEAISYLVRDAVPSYLSSIPIPTSFSGFIKLSVKEWAHLVSFSAVLGGASYLAVKPYYDQYMGAQKDSIMNFRIEKQKEKVYDIIDVEDLGEKTNFCRCWRSKKWPFCDGSHNAFNKLHWRQRRPR